MTRSSESVARRRPATSVVFSIAPPPPYSLALTAARYARFPEIVDRFDGRAYRRWLAVGRGDALLTVEQAGPPSRPRLAVTLQGPDAESAAAREAGENVVLRALGAAADVRPFSLAHARDPVLGDAIRDFAGLRIAGFPSLWEALVTAVLTQQVNLAFAYDIRRHLAVAFGRRARIEGETWFGFPQPRRLLVQGRALRRDFRLSRAKSETLLSLADGFASGALSESEIATLADEPAVERLTSVKGIGRWTAEIALLRGLARPDVFPAADLGVVKYLATGLLGRTSSAREADMRAFAERWRPYRGLALTYAYAELARRKTEA